MPRKAKLTADSARDTEWQLAEYRAQMGREAAERQEHAARLERGECVCRRRTIRTRGFYRTIHDRGCVKWKDWMAEYVTEKKVDTTAFIESALPDNVVPIRSTTSGEEGRVS